MFGFFRKKEDFQVKFDGLHKTLASSFSNIKKDMDHLFDHKEKHSKIMDDIFKRLTRLEEQMENMRVSLLIAQTTKDTETTKLKINPESSEDQCSSDKPIDKKPIEINTLTNIQKSIFLRLVTLSKESDTHWIEMKALASELYPDKDYARVRSLISEYTTLLEERGLLKKRRRGRDTYLALTKKGRKFIPKRKIQIEKEEE